MSPPPPDPEEEKREGEKGRKEVELPGMEDFEAELGRRGVEFEGEGMGRRGAGVRAKGDETPDTLVG